jgi:hypothetical protein
MRSAVMRTSFLRARWRLAWGALVGQALFEPSAPDRPISHRDGVYAAEQFSNRLSVTDPVGNALLGVIRLGDPAPGNCNPRHCGQLTVHGIGFSSDPRALAVVSIVSNSVTYIDTTTNALKHRSYVGRSPHEALFTPDGREIRVTVRGENYICVLDRATYAEKTLTKPGARSGEGDDPTGVVLFDQGLLQVLEAGAADLELAKAYVVALSQQADGGGFHRERRRRRNRQRDRPDKPDGARCLGRSASVAGDRAEPGPQDRSSGSGSAMRG